MMGRDYTNDDYVDRDYLNASETKKLRARVEQLEGEQLRERERGAEQCAHLAERVMQLEGALRTLWRYCEQECGDWWSREIAMQVEAALKKGSAFHWIRPVGPVLGLHAQAEPITRLERIEHAAARLLRLHDDPDQRRRETEKAQRWTELRAALGPAFTKREP
jgi:hypothetical protein